MPGDRVASARRNASARDLIIRSIARLSDACISVALTRSRILSSAAPLVAALIASTRSKYARAFITLRFVAAGAESPRTGQAWNLRCIRSLGGALASSARACRVIRVCGQPRRVTIAGSMVSRSRREVRRDHSREARPVLHGDELVGLAQRHRSSGASVHPRQKRNATCRREPGDVTRASDPRPPKRGRWSKNACRAARADQLDDVRYVSSSKRSIDESPSRHESSRCRSDSTRSKCGMPWMN